MALELIKLPTEQLLTKFGSGGHKPGSGSAAALLGLVSCKLVQTVVTLPEGRDQYQGVQAQLTLANEDVVGDIEPILMAAIQDDSDAFDRVIKARRLRDKEDDKNKKRQLADRALGELRAATDIPLRIAEICIQLRSETRWSWQQSAHRAFGSRRPLSVAWLAIQDRRGEAHSLYVAEGVLARQRGVRRLLRPPEERAVLLSRLAVRDRRGVCRSLGCLHPLIQRGTYQDVAGLPQSRGVPQEPGNRCLTSPKFLSASPLVKLERAATVWTNDRRLGCCSLSGASANSPWRPCGRGICR